MEIIGQEIAVDDKPKKIKKPPSKTSIKNKTVKEMKELGVYKKEYSMIIEMYAELVYQYNILTIRFEDGEYKVDEFTANGGSKKSPIVSTLESLRKDILSYSDRLCLNPKSLDGIKKQARKKSKLEAALESMR